MNSVPLRQPVTASRIISHDAALFKIVLVKVQALKL